jgi:Flp pilus assembly protein TadG
MDRPRNVRRRPTSGQALVEFSLVIVLMMFIVMVLLDGGRVLYAQHTINEAAREGVRLGEVAQSWSQAKYNAIRQRVIDSAPSVGLSTGDVTGDAGACPVPDATSPSTCFYPGSASTGLVAGEDDATVVVNVSTSVDLLTPLAAIWGGTITLTSHAQGYIQCSGCESEPAPTP